MSSYSQSDNSSNMVYTNTNLDLVVERISFPIRGLLSVDDAMKLEFSKTNKTISNEDESRVMNVLDHIIEEEERERKKEEEKYKGLTSLQKKLIKNTVYDIDTKEKFLICPSPSCNYKVLCTINYRLKKGYLKCQCGLDYTDTISYLKTPEKFLEEYKNSDEYMTSKFGELNVNPDDSDLDVEDCSMNVNYDSNSSDSEFDTRF